MLRETASLTSRADTKVYVAGHAGMVGSAILRALKLGGYERLIARSSSELDLSDQHAVEKFFSDERPQHVYLAAAKVGGIHANNSYPVDFIYRNLIIEANVIHAAQRHGADRLLFLGSSCIYPRDAPQPIREEALLTGPLEPTNEPYAIAKIAGIKLCESYNRQYGTDFRSVMPTNLYGPRDNFDLENGHVIPALLRKFHQAKQSHASAVDVWGTGFPRREFLYVEDLADACIFVMELDPDHYRRVTMPMLSHINVGTGSEIAIRDLAELVKEVVGFGGEIQFDRSKPDGVPRKLMDISRLTGLGWKATTDLNEGLRMTYRWFLKNAIAMSE